MMSAAETKERNFDTIANEVTLMILSWLDTFDLFQFFKVYKHLEFLLKARELSWRSNWHGRFELHSFNLCKYITTKMNLSFIKILNINYLFWIPVQDLRNLMSKLSSLEELLAVDTRLGIGEKYVEAYKKLKKLAISVSSQDLCCIKSVDDMNLQILSNMQYLYLKVHLSDIEHQERLSYFICHMKQLEELWIQDSRIPHFRIYYEGLVQRLPKLRKLVIRSDKDMVASSFKDYGFHKVFECRKCNCSTDVIYEKIPGYQKPPAALRIPITPLEKAWHEFDFQLMNIPFGPKESKLIFSGESIEAINFEELDFCHYPFTCNRDCINAAREMLSSPNAKTLKKLQFRCCLLENRQLRGEEEEEEDDTEYRVEFKRRRRGIRVQPMELHPFLNIADNISKLTVVEIKPCKQCHGLPNISAYHLLSKFENLNRLTIRLDHTEDGTFLKMLFLKCKKLEYLMIACSESCNERFMINLCTYLKFANALREFRFDNATINTENVMLSLSAIPTKNILRVVLKCENLRLNGPSHTDPFVEFIRNNNQLLLFYLVVRKGVKKIMTDIQKRIFRMRKCQPGKIYFAKNEDGTMLPRAHDDIIRAPSRVAVINFEDF